MYQVARLLALANESKPYFRASDQIAYGTIERGGELKAIPLRSPTWQAWLYGRYKDETGQAPEVSLIRFISHLLAGALAQQEIM